MGQAQVRIRDAQSAANAYAAMANLGVPTSLPADAAELTMRLKRVSGRGRELAAALQAFVDAKGFDVLADAVLRNRTDRVPDAPARAEAEAAATPGSCSVGEPDGAGLTFAAAGLY